MINRLLEGSEGNLTTSKCAALTGSSQDTALRDIQQLVERGVLVRSAVVLRPRVVYGLTRIARA
ncbi:MAG: DeoR family transcriptional regulator [Acidobacteria bacterium]|nr:DeoR family transcriptional regulator [Acidobacteriota bacterium]